MKTEQENKKTPYKKPNAIVYGIVRFLVWVYAKIVYRPKILRNELKKAKGPYLIIANHQSSLDFMNILPLAKERIVPVISSAYYYTLPFRKLVDSLRFIPKQQFQTSVSDMKKMFEVLASGIPLMIYPTGLMCEDGVPTVTPKATYKFIKYTNVDVYVVKSEGSYMTKPKWSKISRSGRTFIDAYKLIDKETLATLNEEEIKKLVDEAMDFDEYKSQEKNKIRYKRCDNVEGLENVLYRCNGCKTEFSVECKAKRRLICKKCGYTLAADAYGFLHTEDGEVFHVPTISKQTYEDLKTSIQNGKEKSISANGSLYMLDRDKHKFTDRGRIHVVLDVNGFHITKEGEEEKTVSIAGLPMIPFKPGKAIDMQEGATTYRLVFDENEGVKSQKFVNFVKAFYELKDKTATDNVNTAIRAQTVNEEKVSV